MSETEDAHLAFIHLPDDHPIREIANDEVAQEAEHYDGDMSKQEYMERAIGDVGPKVVRREVSNTQWTLREFCAFVLAEDPDVTYDEAAELMNISRGTFGGKVSSEVRTKLARAEETVELGRAVRDGFDRQ